MYDAYYETLFEDGSRFCPRSGNIILEVTDSLELYQGEICDTDIPTWLRRNNHQKSAPRLRLLICSPETYHDDTEVLPLPISRASFESIQAEWQLPSEFLRILLSTMPIITSFSVKKGPTDQSLQGLGSYYAL